MSLWSYANPKKFMDTTAPLLLWLFVLAAVLLIPGWVWGLFFTPDADEQGGIVRIIFIHVPAALMAINTWMIMLSGSLIWLIRRHHVSALIARAGAPVGMVMTLVALITGAIWGQSTWGTWWIWDAQLTSFFVLLLFYLGYIALWNAIEDPDTAADLTSVLCMVGSVFAILSRYASAFWQQGLHQPATLSVDRETHIANVYYYPLILCMVGVVVLCIGLILMRTHTEIRIRRTRALERHLGREA